MKTLVQTLWIPGNRKTTVCIDSYQDGILQGRFCGPEGSAQIFSSLTQFLVMMEQMLEQINEPQSDTLRRSFCSYLLQPNPDVPFSSVPRGSLATFELLILFRQHSSWQGILHWREQRREQSFRSVLELILLMDSALREKEGLETA